MLYTKAFGTFLPGSCLVKMGKILRYIKSCHNLVQPEALFIAKIA